VLIPPSALFTKDNVDQATTYDAQLAELEAKS
jgi:hypothetical protein